MALYCAIDTPSLLAGDGRVNRPGGGYSEVTGETGDDGWFLTQERVLVPTDLASLDRRSQ